MTASSKRHALQESPNDHDLRRAGRRELVAASVMLVAVVVALVLAHRAAFRSVMYFPHVFGGIVSVFALLSLRQARSVAWIPRVFLVLANVGLDDAASGVLSFDGHVTLVNFWADWCGACVSELPMFEAFRKEQGELGVRIVGVTKLYEDTEDANEIGDIVREFEAFVAERGVTYPNVVAAFDSPAYREYRVASLPTSVLIDARGEVIGYGAGVAGTHRLIRLARDRFSADPASAISLDTQPQSVDSNSSFWPKEIR
jgi:thiol-disulfide isomerase/thioredoxin